MSTETAADTVTGVLRARAERTPGAEGCYGRDRPGRWSPRTWGELWQEVGSIAAGLRRLGIQRGEPLAIYARTSYRWQVAEMAGLVAGATIVGVDPHASPDHVEHVLRHSQAVCLLVDDPSRAEPLSEEIQGRLRFAVCFGGVPAAADRAKWHTWGELLDRPPAFDDSAFPTAQPEDPATLIYTSGTTGPPKAIQYSHRQLVVACDAIAGAYPQIGAEDSMLCWLPMAHLFQRMMNLVAIARGTKIYFVEDPREVMTAIQEVQPSVFIAVPRFYERLHEGIRSRLARTPRPWRGLAEAALRTGDAWARCRRSGGRAPLGLRWAHALADLAVLGRLRRVMGGRIKFMITGSAPTPPWLLDFFHSLGLLVLEAYGVSENTVPIASNRPEDFRFGSVGKPFAENEIRLADDGEVLVRGPGVFAGYYRDDRQTARFTPDGFYHTGDVGRLDADGFLYLTGRKAEIIKTSTGRRIAPAQVEAVYARSPYVNQVVVVGNGRKYLVGLVVPRRSEVDRELAARGERPPETGEGTARQLEVRELLSRQFEELGRELAPYERILNFAILPEPLSLERGEITPTLKVRRDRVSASYADVIERLYDEPPIAAQDPLAGGAAL